MEMRQFQSQLRSTFTTKSWEKQAVEPGRLLKDLMPSLFQRLSALWKKPQPAAPVRTPPSFPPARAMTNIVTSSEKAQPEPIFSRAQFLNEDLIYTVLRTCHDPEIPLNIVDLGLIYGVQIINDRVNVTLTIT